MNYLIRWYYIVLPLIACWPNASTAADGRQLGRKIYSLEPVHNDNDNDIKIKVRIPFFFTNSAVAPPPQSGSLLGLLRQPAVVAIEEHNNDVVKTTEVYVRTAHKLFGLSTGDIWMTFTSDLRDPTKQIFNEAQNYCLTMMSLILNQSGIQPPMAIDLIRFEPIEGISAIFRLSILTEDLPRLVDSRWKYLEGGSFRMATVNEALSAEDVVVKVLGQIDTPSLIEADLICSDPAGYFCTCIANPTDCPTGRRISLVTEKVCSQRCGAQQHGLMCHSTANDCFCYANNSISAAECSNMKHFATTQECNNQCAEIMTMSAVNEPLSTEVITSTTEPELTEMASANEAATDNAGIFVCADPKSNYCSCSADFSACPNQISQLAFGSLDFCYSMCNIPDDSTLTIQCRYKSHYSKDCFCFAKETAGQIGGCLQTKDFDSLSKCVADCGSLPSDPVDQLRRLRAFS